MVLYGGDKRFEFSQPGRLTAAQQAAARSVGCLVNASQLRANPDNTYSFTNQVYSARQLLMWMNRANNPTGLQNDIKFADQTSLGFATAFLVGPGLICTAGHATWKDPPTVPNIDFRNVTDINSFYFVLDWAMTWTGNNWVQPDRIPANSVYQIDRIIRMTPAANQPILPGGPDFLIMTLRRNVVDRGTLQFANDRPQDNTQVWIAGHPLGIPLKCETGLMERYPRTPGDLQTFLCFHGLSTYGGHSGSPIMNQQGQVLAIHVKGSSTADFSVDNTNHLVTANVLPVFGNDLGSLSKGMRTDALRWMFSTDARVRLNIEFKGTVPGDCDLSIYHSTNEVSPGTHLGDLQITEMPGTRVLDCDIPFAGNLRPLDLRYLEFQIADRNGALSRQVERVRIMAMNPANMEERIDLWYTKAFVVTPDRVSVSFVYRILENPVWTSNDGTWPPNWPRPV